MVKITVLNDAGQPMPAASVQLLNMDSTLLQTQGTDKTGIADFPGLKDDSYILKITYAGYQDFYVAIKDLQKTGAFSKTVNMQQAAQF